jgi:uncharacterized membrane protein YfcA
LPPFIILLIFFFAAFTQSLTGFGDALVAMALLPGLIGIQTSAPLVAIFALTIELVVLGRHWRSLNLRAILPIILTSAIGIPLGIWALQGVDENLVLSFLGGLIAAYAIYSLLNLKLPELNQPAWAYLFGLFAGLLGGAYNTSGPPVVIYGNARRWPPREFKSNLQSIFVLNSAMVFGGHAISGNVTPEVWQLYLWSIPAILLGFLAGNKMDHYLDADRFRRIVLWLLIVLGLRLIFS